MVKGFRGLENTGNAALPNSGAMSGMTTKATTRYTPEKKKNL